MKVDIRDNNTLETISPEAIIAYARGEGWTRLEPYGDYSDVYVADNLPEIILPRTQRLGDYADVVARLIKVFADATHRDELSLYRDLVTADRDVVRVRVDGSLSVDRGIGLVAGARNMLLAAAYSLRQPQSVYARTTKEANDLVNRVRLGQTEQGSFVVTLLTPAIPTPLQAMPPDPDDRNAPIERRMTKRLAEALIATHAAVQSRIEDEGRAFHSAVDKGVSANLCEALTELIGPFSTLDVGITWARTRLMPWMIGSPRVVRFSRADSSILSEAARTFREHEPRLGIKLSGIVPRLNRQEMEDAGTISLRTSIDDRPRSVKVFLRQADYERAIRAHRDKTSIVLRGDLERVGERWHLLGARFI